MNGFYVLVLAATILGAVYVVPRLMRLDAVLADMEGLDDEELAAVLAEFPDVLVRVSKW